MEQLELAFLLNVALGDAARHKGKWAANDYRGSLAHAEEQWQNGVTAATAQFGAAGGLWDLELGLWVVRAAAVNAVARSRLLSWADPLLGDAGVVSWKDPSLQASAQQNLYLLEQAYDERIVTWVRELRAACVADAHLNGGVSSFFSYLHASNGGVLEDGGIAAATPAQVVRNSDLFAAVRPAAQSDGRIRIERAAAEEVVEADFELVLNVKNKTAEIAKLDPAKPPDADVAAALDLTPAELIGDPDAQAALKEKAKQADDNKDLLKNAKGTVVAVATVARLFDAEFADDLERVGKAAIATVEAGVEFFNAAAKLGEALSVASALGTAAATGNIVGAVTTLVSVFLDPDGKAKPDQAVRNEIKATRADIKKLGDQMRKRFDRIDEALNKIYGTMVKELDAIDLELEEIRVDVAHVQQAIAEQALTLQRLEDRLVRILKTESRRELRSGLLNGLGWRAQTSEPMSRAEFNGFVKTFRDYAVIHCTDSLETGDEADRSTADDKLAHELSSWPLHENVAFIDGYLRDKHWPTFTTPGAPRLGNPFTWALAASGYAQIRINWPEFGGTLTEEDAYQVRSEGDRIAASLATIAPNVELFERLHENYDAKVKAYADALQDATDRYLDTNLRRRLGLSSSEPLPDLWGDAAQPNDFRPAGLATMTNGASAGAVTAPASVRGLVPQVCVNADWLEPAANDALDIRYATAWVDVVPNPHNPKTDPDAPDWYGRVRLVVTPRFAGKTLARRSVVSGKVAGYGEREDGPGAPGKSLLDAFDARSSDEGLSTSEQADLEQLIGTTLSGVEERMQDERAQLYLALATLTAEQHPSPGNRVAFAAIELTGARLLLESMISLGFPRARTGDDLLSSILRPPTAADAAGVLPDQTAFASALRGLTQTDPPLVSTDGKPLRAWAIETADRLHQIVRDCLDEWRKALGSGAYAESVPLIQRSQLRLDVAQRALAPDQKEEDIVSQLPTVKAGSSKASVRRVQGLLRAANPTLTDAQLPVNGTFGPKTARYVKEIQQKNQLPTSGIVDTATWRALLGVSRHA